VLLKAGVAEEEIARIEAETKAAVGEAERAAREAPDPDPATATTQVWADGGSAWRS
jgi:pyruvate dehydrogenase E1 component alpha subunit